MISQNHTGNNSVGARIFAPSLSTATQPQTEDTQREPQRAADSTDDRANEPRLLHHAKLHSTHRIWTYEHTTFHFLQSTDTDDISYK